MNTQQRLANTMQEHPEITYAGWTPTRRMRTASPEYDASRERLAQAVGEFEITYAWATSHLWPIKTLNRSRTSYGLKHIVEKAIGGYVANGTLIAAMLAAGYRCMPTHFDSPNTFFNLSEKAVHKAEKALWRSSV